MKKVVDCYFFLNIKELFYPSVIGESQEKSDRKIERLASNLSLLELKCMLKAYIKYLEKTGTVEGNDRDVQRAQVYVPIILTQIENVKSQTLAILALVIAIFAIVISILF